jgi:hypothetical protein
MDALLVTSPQSVQSHSNLLIRAIEDRIARVTDSTLTADDLWPSVSGPMATRESRMEVVAWMAVCNFDCSLEGGFVRDWIVANERARPSPTVPTSEWIVFQHNTGAPSLIKTVVPSDLDCKMSLDHYFDIERFCDEVKKFDLKSRLYRSRRSYRLLFDEHQPTGPFIVEFIEPYSQIGFSIPDLDVNNLCLKRDQCKELGQRMDLKKSPYLIDLIQIIENIQSKQFHVIPSIDALIAGCIDKMTKRGWIQKGAPLINRPQRVIHKFIVNPLSATSDVYKRIENEMQAIIGVTIVSVEHIHNPVLGSVYESVKQLIANQCPGNNPNERFLYHGTHASKAHVIMEDGFDYGFLKIHGRFGKFSSYC